MTARHAAAALDLLLDALEAEILAASDDDIQAAVAATGRLRDAALREVKSVLIGERRGRKGRPQLNPGSLVTSRPMRPHRPPAD